MDKPEENSAFHEAGKILLVDDELPILEMMKRMLGRTGKGVLCSSTYSSAEETFRNNIDQIEIVIADYSLPGGKGSDLIKAMKEIKPGVKCVLSSGYGMSAMAMEGKMPYCDAFLEKPYTYARLNRLVHELAGGS